ncbi:hypothetical protein CIB93_11685 [Streptomyces sp. WZ.A104]|uniref:hypothetical protein n=1 Tax=Streptomyces sp. WZ.A104 TaxID=2023771 RepID=UPI000BBC0494|nr:hypothetical protein [Streptomyces sp. WZ.A104]PCG85957.1 hypothetical protein CIB93_11685 [Streptomyces sp. WZ.A104]
MFVIDIRVILHPDDLERGGGAGGAVVAGSAITPSIEPATLPLRWVSASVLVVLALRGAATAVHQYRRRQTTARADDRPPLTPARACTGLLAPTMVNPMT